MYPLDLFVLHKKSSQKSLMYVEFNNYDKDNYVHGNQGRCSGYQH